MFSSYVDRGEWMAVAADRVRSQIRATAKQTTTARTSKLRWLLPAIVAPMPSQIAVQVVRTSTALTFVPGWGKRDDNSVDNRRSGKRKQQQIRRKTARFKKKTSSSNGSDFISIHSPHTNLPLTRNLINGFHHEAVWQILS